MNRGLKIGGRLDRYVGASFVSSYATAFLILVGLFVILDMASNLDEYLRTWKDGSKPPIGLIVRYYVLNLPFVFLQVAPFVTLVAGMFTASRLHKHSEITASLSAGVGLHRLFAPVLLGAVLSGWIMFELRETLGSTLGRQRDAVKYVLDRQQYDEVYFELWLRDLNGGVVHIHEFRPASRTQPVPEVRGLEATLPRATHQWSSTSATSARYEVRDGVLAWWLENGQHREIIDVKQTRPIDRLQGFDFTPELVLSVNRAHENPLELSYRETRELARRDPDSVVYKMLEQYCVTSPAACLVLLLIGLPLLLRRESRAGGIEGVAGGFVLCIFYFAMDFVLKNLGLEGAMDPYMAAWLPILVFGSLGLAMFVAMDS